jgi:predicted Rossmann fold flavoprotein
LEGLGHTIIPPVPSLFTFNIPNSPFSELAGISVEKVEAKIQGTLLKQTGPLLITHWGFSGPAILKLSAWGARLLHERAYKATLQVNWLPEMSLSDIKEMLLGFKISAPARLLINEGPDKLPRNLWKKLAERAGATATLRWSHLSSALLQKLIFELSSSEFKIEGKTTYKEEFVTCGGVALDEIDFKTMQSKKIPNLYFAGEVLDIDGVTGGFNFQNAWTTGFIAGKSMSE